jgi:hypothetical protein
LTGEDRRLTAAEARLVDLAVALALDPPAVAERRRWAAEIGAALRAAEGVPPRLTVIRHDLDVLAEVWASGADDFRAMFALSSGVARFFRARWARAMSEAA